MGLLRVLFGRKPRPEAALPAEPVSIQPTLVQSSQPLGLTPETIEATRMLALRLSELEALTELEDEYLGAAMRSVSNMHRRGLKRQFHFDHMQAGMPQVMAEEQPTRSRRKTELGDRISKILEG